MEIEDQERKRGLNQRLQLFAAAQMQRSLLDRSLVLPPQASLEDRARALGALPAEDEEHEILRLALVMQGGLAKSSFLANREAMKDFQLGRELGIQASPAQSSTDNDACETALVPNERRLLAWLESADRRRDASILDSPGVSKLRPDASDRRRCELQLGTFVVPDLRESRLALPNPESIKLVDLTRGLANGRRGGYRLWKR
jgi:hypothetical protein